MSGVKADTLRSIVFFSDLDERAFSGLAALCYRQTFQPGESIISHLDDRKLDVLFLLSGRARVNIYSSGGHKVSFREITPGAIFGELSAIDGEPRSATVEAIEPSSIAGMPRHVFQAALCDHPEFMAAVLKHLTKQVRSLTARVFEFSTMAVRNRLHSELLRMAVAQQTGNEATLSPNLTHDEMASRISTHREAVSRELSRLEEQGLIVKRGRQLHVADIGKLRSLVERSAED